MIYNLVELARRQLINYNYVNPGTCYGEESFALTIEEAYAVQDAVVSLRVEGR